MAQNGEFIFVCVLFSLGAFIGIGLAFNRLKRARMMQDTPTSRIRSASQGFVELRGHARTLPGPDIISPLSQTRCVWWSYTIQEKNNRRSSSNNKGWKTIESEQSDDLFLLNDGTAECVVDPDGAEITPSLHRRWYGSTMRPSRVPKSGTAWIGFGNYRYTEKILGLGELVYALGFFRTENNQVARYNEDLDVKELLSKWKADKRELLKRFDLNDDGEIDLDEWEKVRSAALIQVRKMHLEQSIDPDIHVLSRPADRRPYILSPKDPDVLVKKLRTHFLVSLSIGLALAYMTFHFLQSRGIFY